MEEPDLHGAWRVHGTRPLYESRWLSLDLADVELPSGERFEHHTVRMPAAAVAVVFDPAGENVLLTWRHRFVPGVWNYELPGGIVEDREDPATAIRREILEETGHEVGDVTLVTTFEPMIGMVTSPHHVFVARDARRVAEPVERDEGTFEWVPVAELRGLIASDRVRNSGTLVGLLAVLSDLWVASWHSLEPPAQSFGVRVWRRCSRFSWRTDPPR